MSFWKYTPIQTEESYSMRFFRSVLWLRSLTSWVMVPCNHRSFEFKDHWNLWGYMKHLGTCTGPYFRRVHFKKNSLHMPAQLGKGPFSMKGSEEAVKLCLHTFPKTSLLCVLGNTFNSLKTLNLHWCFVSNFLTNLHKRSFSFTVLFLALRSLKVT